MRVLGWVVLVLLLPGRIWATPEPPPPGDFPGAQYIDRTGCVFVRQGTDWVPRLDKDGAPICGFPPSQPALAAVPETPLPSPEEALTDMLAQGLRAGDLATDQPAAPLGQAAPDPAQAVLDATLQDQIEIEARLRSAMAGQAPEGLCARLGYRPATDQTPIIGGDVTQGLCPGMTAPKLQPQLSAAVAATPLPTAPDAPSPAVATETPEPVSKDTPAPKPVRRAEPAAKPAAVKSASVIARTPAAPSVEKPDPVEMIPANARYVEIGIYADAANAMAALRRLSGLGYSTAQRDQKVGNRSGKAILAGPFSDRQALVTALTRLRANGYPRAVAR